MAWAKLGWPHRLWPTRTVREGVPIRVRWWLAVLGRYRAATR